MILDGWDTLTLEELHMLQNSAPYMKASLCAKVGKHCMDCPAIKIRVQGLSVIRDLCDVYGQNEIDGFEVAILAEHEIDKRTGYYERHLD